MPQIDSSHLAVLFSHLSQNTFEPAQTISKTGDEKTVQSKLRFTPYQSFNNKPASLNSTYAEHVAIKYVTKKDANCKNCAQLLIVQPETVEYKCWGGK